MPLHDTHRARRSGTGRPVVLVHGLGATYDCWRYVEPLLRPHREVVVMDLPGFGAAEPLGGDVTVDAFADHLADLLAEEGLLDADLVGSSMGGEVVLELLRRGVGTGDVVALAPSGYWGPGGLVWFRTVAWTATVLVTVLRPVAHRVLGQRVGPPAAAAPAVPRAGAAAGGHRRQQPDVRQHPGVPARAAPPRQPPPARPGARRAGPAAAG